MNSREVQSIEEATAIVEPLMNENKWAITVKQKPDGAYVISWIEHKFYTAQDGKQYRDEVWTTKDGEMKLIQDLEPEHARNIIRMLLRQEREAKDALDALFQKVITENALDDNDDEDTYFPEWNSEKKGTLH